MRVASIRRPQRQSAPANLPCSSSPRVIELYNVRAGATRTGAYHAQGGTEDGFAPGA